MTFDNFTLGVNFFNTPELVLPFLKSFVYHHKDTFKICISDNSTEINTSKILDSLNLKYLINKGLTHSLGIDKIFEAVTTDYLILCDSDILFLKPIDRILQMMVDSKLELMGELQGSRGGYNISPRIDPKFCIINLKNIKSHNIKFHDEAMIKLHKSEGFHNNIPIQENDGQKKYDCGSAFYEKLIDNNLRVASLAGLNEYVYHAEGLSWRTKSGIDQYVQWGNRVFNEYMIESKKYENVDLKGKFESV